MRRHEEDSDLPSVDVLAGELRRWSLAFDDPHAVTPNGAGVVFLPRGWAEGRRSAEFGWVLRLDSPPVGSWGREFVPAASRERRWDAGAAAERLLSAARKVVSTWEGR